MYDHDLLIGPALPTTDECLPAGLAINNRQYLAFFERGFIDFRRRKGGR